MELPKFNPAIRAAMLRVAELSRVRRLRSMRQFAEQELMLATGPYADLRFRADRQPWNGLWLDALDSGDWRRFLLTGPSQSGKTLMGSALPVIYHLFESRETVIYAAPQADMANDKWREDIKPIIEASQYRDLLPTTGSGSKGGTPTAIQFRHGPTLRFMTGGGSDKTVSAFTSRITVITEIDGMDEAGELSRETDRVSQLEARTNAFGDRARIYLECTVSTEEGRTWRELKAGTDTRIVMPCPHCRKWVTPDREHLTGWQDAQSVAEARERAALCCPQCGAAWSEADRTGANARAKLAHKGQTVDDSGAVMGIGPQTHTLGLRFTAANNLLTTMSRVAEEEWQAPRTTDAVLAERKLRQFYWTLPSEPESITLSEMDAAAICVRVIDVPRGRVPADALKLTVGIDAGKWLCHWVAVAWCAGGRPHVLDYGRLDVPSRDMAEEQAILNTLRRFRDDVCVNGWLGVDGKAMRPSLTLVDAGNWENTIVTFCVESGPGFMPTKGFSERQVGNRRSMIDPGYEPVKMPLGYVLLEVNADRWKTYLHARLQTPIGGPGALTLYSAPPTEHLALAKHWTAEKRVEEFEAGRGLVSRWERVNKSNHFLDSAALACVAGHGVGARIVEAVPVAPPPPANDKWREQYVSNNPLRYKGKW